MWAASEYNKLPHYDGPMGKQWPSEQAWARFDCHLDNGNLCAGWIGCHKAQNLLAMRIASLERTIDDAVWNYESPVPLFKSGAEAAAHGKRAINRPGQRARRVIARLIRKRERDNG